MAARVSLFLALGALLAGPPLLGATHAPYDLAAADISTYPQPPVAGEVLDFYIHYRGEGPSPEADFTLRVDGAPVAAGKIGSREGTWSPGWPGDGFSAWRRLAAVWTATEGTHTVRLEITYAAGQDRDPANDAYEESLVVPGQRVCSEPGPDAAGYTCAVSPFVWADLGSVPSVSAVGGSSLAVAVAGFPFYNIPRAAAVADPNGYLAFTPGAPEARAQRVPDPAAPNDRVAAFHSNLRNTHLRAAVVLMDGLPVTVVEWSDWDRACCSGPPSAAQAHLFPDGTIRVSLRMAASLHQEPASIGIEGPLGTSGVAFHYGETRLDGMSVTFRPGTLPPP